MKAQDKTKTNKKAGLTANEKKLVGALNALSAIAVRASIAARLGKSFSGDRDLYDALGYILKPSFEDYMAKYHRQDIARAIIDKPVEDSWSKVPQITESEEKETKFEKEWEALVKSKRIFYQFSRVDRLAGIGTYAVLFLGFDDTDNLATPVKKAKRLLYLTPYSMKNATISSKETNPKNERFGMPQEYSININSSNTSGSTSTLSKKVHWSRVIHVAEDLLEDEVEGIPRLRNVLNRLMNLELILGGSAEGIWRGGFPGFGFSKKEGAQFGTQDEDTLTDEIEEYLHGFKRYLRLQGIDIQELKPQVADPSNHIGVQIDLISAAKGMPKRILMGSERGELASSQDERNWAKKMSVRRTNYCEPVILRPFIDRLIQFGVLTKPTEEYTVVWPDLMVPSEKERADVGQIKTKALKDYVDAIGADTVVPVEVFLEDVLGFSKELVEKINLIREEISKKEAKEEGEE